MALSKVEYEDLVTVIPAQNLNDIQDEIINNETNIDQLQDEIIDNEKNTDKLQAEIEAVESCVGLPVINSNLYELNVCAKLSGNDVIIEESESYKMVKLACQSRDKFTLSGVSTEEVPAYIFATDTNQRTSWSAPGTFTNKVVDANSDAAWLYINMPIESNYVNFYGAWDKTLKELVDKARLYFGVCTTNANQTAKLVNILRVIDDEKPPLLDGDLLLVSFGKGNTAENMSLVINQTSPGTLVRAGFYVRSTLQSAFPLTAGQTVLFRYERGNPPYWRALAVSPSVTPIPNRVVATDPYGIVDISSVTTSELRALQGVKGNIQEQLENPNLTAGSAEQLLTDKGITDTEPYLVRQSKSIGTRLKDKVVGGSLVVNQLVPQQTTITRNGVTLTAYNNGKCTISGTATATTFFNILDNLPNNNHKYLVMGGSATSLSSNCYLYVWRHDSGYTQLYNGKTSAVLSSARTMLITVVEGQTIDMVYYPQLIDLTAMFGSTIADYIYSLEQSTAGAGVEWFKKYFPLDYYPYNSGEIQSVTASAHKMVGFNQWDEEWENGYYGSDGQPYDGDGIRGENYIPIIPSTQYYAKSNGNNLYVCQYDSNKNFIGTRQTIVDGAFTTLANAQFMQFSVGTAYGTTYNHDICINIFNADRNGEYEPYVEYNYPLDESLTLSGIPKLDSSNNLVYDGDIYESDGTVTRRYDESNLGERAYTQQSGINGLWAFSNVISNMKRNSSNNSKVGLMCSKYTEVTPDQAYSGTKGIAITTNGNVWIYDNSYSTAQEIKEALLGEMLVYPLATPSTESAEPFQNPQIVDKYGTEEYITDGIVPVGHETFYLEDLKNKLESAPDSPVNDGDYIVRRENGENKYVSADVIIGDIGTVLDTINGEVI